MKNNNTIDSPNTSVEFCQLCNKKEWEAKIKDIKLCDICYAKTASALCHPKRGNQIRSKLFKTRPDRPKKQNY
jgi:hypothetical protein